MAGNAMICFAIGQSFFLCNVVIGCLSLATSVSPLKAFRLPLAWKKEKEKKKYCAECNGHLSEVPCSLGAIPPFFEC